MTAALTLLVCLAALPSRCAEPRIATFETMPECVASADAVADAWRVQHPGWVWLRKRCEAA